MLKNNIHYFKYCARNPEILDPCYMFVKQNPHLNEYVSNTIKIKELTTAIKVLSAKEKGTSYLYKDLHKLLSSKYSTTSELNCFMNACDCSIKSLKNDTPLLKNLVDLYLKNRVISPLTPKEWVQAILDKRASASK